MKKTIHYYSAKKGDFEARFATDDDTIYLWADDGNEIDFSINKEDLLTIHNILSKLTHELIEDKILSQEEVL